MIAKIVEALEKEIKPYSDPSKHTNFIRGFVVGTVNALAVIEEICLKEND